MRRRQKQTSNKHRFARDNIAVSYIYYCHKSTSYQIIMGTSSWHRLGRKGYKTMGNWPFIDYTVDVMAQKQRPAWRKHNCITWSFVFFAIQEPLSRTLSVQRHPKHSDLSRPELGPCPSTFSQQHTKDVIAILKKHTRYRTTQALTFYCTAFSRCWDRIYRRGNDDGISNADSYENIYLPLDLRKEGSYISQHDTN